MQLHCAGVFTRADVHRTTIQNGKERLLWNGVFAHDTSQLNSQSAAMLHAAVAAVSGIVAADSVTPGIKGTALFPSLARLIHNVVHYPAKGVEDLHCPAARRLQAGNGKGPGEVGVAACPGLLLVIRGGHFSWDLVGAHAIRMPSWVTFSR